MFRTLCMYASPLMTCVAVYLISKYFEFRSNKCNWSLRLSLKRPKRCRMCSTEPAAASSKNMTWAILVTISLKKEMMLRWCRERNSRASLRELASARLYRVVRFIASPVRVVSLNTSKTVPNPRNSFPEKWKVQKIRICWGLETSS